jgi:hypothetical protein
MQARKRPCQHFAGQVLVSGMPSGALTWTLRYVGDMCLSIINLHYIKPKCTNGRE